METTYIRDFEAVAIFHAYKYWRTFEWELTLKMLSALYKEYKWELPVTVKAVGLLAQSRIVDSHLPLLFADEIKKPDLDACYQALIAIQEHMNSRK